MCVRLLEFVLGSVIIIRRQGGGERTSVTSTMCGFAPNESATAGCDAVDTMPAARCSNGYKSGTSAAPRGLACGVVATAYTKPSERMSPVTTVRDGHPRGGGATVNSGVTSPRVVLL